MVQLREWGKDEAELLVDSAATLRWKHIFHLIGEEAQIHQKAAPDANGEDDSQVWCESFLLGGEKGKTLRQGQVCSWWGALPTMGTSGEQPQAWPPKSSFLVPRPL